MGFEHVYDGTACNFRGGNACMNGSHYPNSGVAQLMCMPWTAGGVNMGCGSTHGTDSGCPACGVFGSGDYQCPKCGADLSESLANVTRDHCIACGFADLSGIQKEIKLKYDPRRDLSPLTAAPQSPPQLYGVWHVGPTTIGNWVTMKSSDQPRDIASWAAGTRAEAERLCAHMRSCKFAGTTYEVVPFDAERSAIPLTAAQRQEQRMEMSFKEVRTTHAHSGITLVRNSDGSVHAFDAEGKGVGRLNGSESQRAVTKLLDDENILPGAPIADRVRELLAMRTGSDSLDQLRSERDQWKARCKSLGIDENTTDAIRADKSTITLIRKSNGEVFAQDADGNCVGHLRANVDPSIEQQRMQLADKLTRVEAEWNDALAYIAKLESKWEDFRRFVGSKTAERYDRLRAKERIK